MNDVVRSVLDHIAEVVDLVGIAIMLIGFVLSLGMLVKVQIKHSRGPEFFHYTRALRCRLGTYLLLALEFMIVSDLIMTVTHPTMEELIHIAALVGIRTAIGFFLGKELAEVRSEE